MNIWKDLIHSCLFSFNSAFLYARLVPGISKESSAHVCNHVIKWVIIMPTPKQDGGIVYIRASYILMCSKLLK